MTTELGCRRYLKECYTLKERKKKSALAIRAKERIQIYRYRDG